MTPRPSRALPAGGELVPSKHYAGGEPTAVKSRFFQRSGRGQEVGEERAEFLLDGAGEDFAEPALLGGQYIRA